MNDSGDVVGSSETASGETHAFLWTRKDGMTDLGTLPGGTYSSAEDVNESDDVVGSSESASSPNHAFRWTKSDGMLDLGTFPGGIFSYAAGVNNSGDVVGTSNAASGGGLFFWTRKDGMIDVGALAGVRGGAMDVNAKRRRDSWSGRYWARTSDLRLVEAALSQLS